MSRSPAVAAATLAIQAGDNQTATAGSQVAVDPAVLVTDGGGNPVASVAVTFAVATGGGSIGGANAVTDASGIAEVGGWTLGPIAGPNTLTATSAGLSGSPVTFHATGTAGSAGKLRHQDPAVEHCSEWSPDRAATGNPAAGSERQ